MGKVKKTIFEKFFSSRGSNGKLLLDDDESTIASSVFDVAWQTINPGQENTDDSDTSLLESLDGKVEATLNRFGHVVEVFKKSNDAWEQFLDSFDDWAEPCKKGIRSMRDLAEEMQKDKFNSDVNRGVGSVVGAIGGAMVGLSFFPSMAALSPLLIVEGGLLFTLGNGLVVGTTCVEINRLKRELEKAKTLVMEEKERFSPMTQWFTAPHELEDAIRALLDYDISAKIAQEVEIFNKMTSQKDMTDDELNVQFKLVLKSCMGQMAKDSKMIDEYGKELSPAVMTFVFLACLLKDPNRIIMNCAWITQRLALGLLTGLNLGGIGGGIINILAAEGAASAIAKFVVSETFVWFCVAIDVMVAALSLRNICKQPESEDVKKLKEVASNFEKVLYYIECVYDEVKKYKSQEVDMIQWTTVIVSQAPDDVGDEELKAAVKHHLPEEACHHINLQRLETTGNNWLVKVPKIHSQMLLQQTHINIKGKNCVVIP